MFTQQQIEKAYLVAFQLGTLCRAFVMNRMLDKWSMAVSAAKCVTLMLGILFCIILKVDTFWVWMQWKLDVLKYIFQDMFQGMQIQMAFADGMSQGVVIGFLLGVLFLKQSKKQW